MSDVAHADCYFQLMVRNNIATADPALISATIYAPNTATLVMDHLANSGGAAARGYGGSQSEG